MARTSECTGAYFGSISITATERPVDLSGSIDLTLPTGTPEIRTSASLASWVASAKDTWKRYPFGLSGIGPPNASHRNSSRPKHDSAKITIAAMRPNEGALLTTEPPIIRGCLGAVGRVRGDRPRFHVAGHLVRGRSTLAKGHGAEAPRESGVPWFNHRRPPVPGMKTGTARGGSGR